MVQIDVFLIYQVDYFSFYSRNYHHLIPKIVCISTTKLTKSNYFIIFVPLIIYIPCTYKYAYLLLRYLSNRMAIICANIFNTHGSGINKKPRDNGSIQPMVVLQLG